MANKIGLLGDIHGNFDKLFEKAIEAERNGAGALIQVGDFGYYPQTPRSFMRLKEAWMWAKNELQNPKFPIYYIDGNHDPCTFYREYYKGRPEFVGSFEVPLDGANIRHLRRGATVDILEYRVCTLGGAASIDVAGIIEDRVRNGIPRERAEREQVSEYWSKDENISNYEANRAASGGRCDLFVTHAPTLAMCHRYFNPMTKVMFGVGLDWEDPNMSVIESVWRAKGHPPHVCGHMHKTVREEFSIILDIDQLMYFERGEFYR